MRWTDASTADNTKPTLTAALIATVCAFGMVAIALGQTNSWDLRNYHLYDGWAFWTGRGARDFAAAQVQSYFNPLLATATYLLFTHTPPRLSAFVLGVIQGANIVPLYLLARRFLPAEVRIRYRWLPLLVAIIGGLGATQLGELGSSMGDNLVSLPILCAFALVFCSASPGWPHAAWAGLLLGIATGIKLTAAPFALGLISAVPFLATRAALRWRLLLAAGLAASCGFLAVDGFWLVRMYRDFGDPLFPQFAHLFGGEYAPPMSLRDVRSLPSSLFEGLFYPFAWVRSPHLVSDAWFFDLRVPLGFVAIAALLWRRGEPPADRSVRVLAAALGVAYLLWLGLFGVYRYLAPLEMLAPLLVVLAFASAGRRQLGPTAGMVLVLLVIMTRPAGWGRIPPDAATFLQTEIPNVPALEQSTIVLAEDEPLAFLAVGFPPGATFVRVGGNLLGPPFPVYAMDREAARRIDAARGPLYALLAAPQAAQTVAALARQRLTIHAECLRVRSNLLRGTHRAALCPLERALMPDLRSNPQAATSATIDGSRRDEP